MSRLVNSVAVLGAGTMGAQIAAHFANAGLPVRLFDLTAGLARDGLNRARALKPDPLFTPDMHRLITPGGFDGDLTRIAESDWIIEAIVEQLDHKQALLAKVDACRRPGTIVSSNTSGLPIAALAEGRSADFRRHWLGTHFFNPPRYLTLLELIPTTDTDPLVTSAVSAFAAHRLGKGVVIAKDTPNFIANHIGLYGLIRILAALEDGRWTVEEIDAITGPVLGRPKSATFRTVDIAGLDILGHVAGNLTARLERDADRAAFTLPRLVGDMIARGWVGEKAGQGFYRREKVADSESRILVLDPKSMEYRPRQSVRLASLEAARTITDPRERIRTLFLGRDRVGAFLRETLGPTLLYTARVAPEIAHSIDDVDRAMRWGFGWELGPFEIWDAIGIRDLMSTCAVPQPSATPDRPTAKSASADTVRTLDAPPLVHGALERGGDTFRTAPLAPAAPDLEILRSAKERRGLVRRNAGASLVDLGDGVLAVEFHSKMNAIGGDTIEMLNAGVAEASRNFAALVIGNDAPHFSAGANLMLLLLEAKEENWDEVDLMVRSFQAATTNLRRAPVPVVVAPAGLTLGGGCEVMLHADRVQAAAESYIGLVEVGVGLIPAGGGTKELLVRSTAASADARQDALAAAQRAFETIGFAKTSASAPDARRLGYLRDTDGVSMNRERLMFDAKAHALQMVRDGYQPPAPLSAISVGGEGVLAALKLGIHLAWRAGRITDHDVVIGRKLAWVLSGGSAPHATTVTEQYMLDLERETFLSLCGEPKTQERMAHTLRTGKTLRN